jgi:hypothetical protein
MIRAIGMGYFREIREHKVSKKMNCCRKADEATDFDFGV